MKIKKEELMINEKLIKRIDILCRMNKMRLEIVKGYYIKVENTNINILEPHKFLLINKDEMTITLLCYDNMNLTLENKENISIKNITDIVKKMGK